MELHPTPHLRCLAAVSFACLGVAPLGAAQDAPAAQRPVSPAAARLLDTLPARFVPNRGQWASPELYRVAVGGLRVFLEERGWSFWLVGDSEPQGGAAPAGGRTGCFRAEPPRSLSALAVRMTFVDAAGPRLVPGHRLAGEQSYVIGSDATRHRAGVPAFASVRYASMYDGIDVCVREADGQLEYDLLLEPGADLAQARLRVDGATSLRIDAEGALVMATELGSIRQPRPRTWMVTESGTRRQVACDFVLHGSQTFGFAAPDRDPGQRLVVDPPILYSTLVGGSANEVPSIIRETAAGKILICGRTLSLDFPTKAGSLQTVHGGGTGDGYILRIDPSQPPASQVEFATYFGGSLDDGVADMQEMPGGLVSFAGFTRSINLPVTASAYQKTPPGQLDCFVGLLSASGDKLLGLSYLGGSSDDRAIGLAHTAAGEVLVAGGTLSSNFPTTANAYDGSHNGAWDGFLTRIDMLATTVSYSTFVGGSSNDELYPLPEVTATGVVTLTGSTQSSNFPVTGNALDTTFGGGPKFSQDGILVQLDTLAPPPQQLVYSTFLGGSGDEFVYQVRRASSGQLVLSGTTTSRDFPTTGDSYAPTYVGGNAPGNGLTGDGFVLRLDPSKSGQQGLVFGTFLGGPTEDQGLDCVVDSDDTITLVGWTGASNNALPTTPGALRRSYALNDGFVARLSADGRQLLYSTYLGGTNHDGAWLVARHQDGMATAYGSTQSADYPTKNAFQSTHGGGADAFVTRLSLIPANTKRYGAPTRGAGGWPTIHALDDATNGNQNFGLGCTSGPSNKPGLLAIGTASWPGVKVLGIALHVDVLGPSLLLPVQTTGAGESVTPLPYPQGGAGTLYAQYVWFENGPQAVSASDALRIQ